MSKFRIYYTVKNSETRESAYGISADAAYRKVKDHNSNQVLVKKGRKTVPQFVKMAKDMGVTILKMEKRTKTTPWETVYDSGVKLPEDIKKKPEQPKVEVKPKMHKEYFHDYEIVERLDGTFRIYTMEGKMVAQKDHLETAKNYILNLIKDKQPKVEPIIEDVKVMEDVKIEEPKAEVVDNGGAAIAALVRPHLLGDMNVDDNKLKAYVKEAVLDTTRRVEIKIADKPVVVVENQHYNFEHLLTMVANRKNVVLVGPAGTGKTHAAKEIAEQLNLKFYAESLNSQSTKFEWMGFIDANGKFTSTKLYEAFKDGGLFLLDEMDRGSERALVALNSILANGWGSFANGMVQRHPDFRVIAAANTYGLGADGTYTSATKLDGSTRNRFGMMPWGYDKQMELALSTNLKWTDYLHRMRDAVDRLKIKDVIISIRQMIDGGDLLNVNMPLDLVQEMYLWAGIKPSVKQKLEAEVKYHN